MRTHQQNTPSIPWGQIYLCVGIVIALGVVGNMDYRDAQASTTDQLADQVLQLQGEKRLLETQIELERTRASLDVCLASNASGVQP